MISISTRLEHALHMEGINLYPVSRLKGGLRGLWDSHYRAIYVRDDMPHLQTEWVVAHEIGHALCDHDTCVGQHYAAVAEREADQAGAGLLVTAEELAKALYPGITDLELAIALTVYPDVVEALKGIYQPAQVRPQAAAPRFARWGGTVSA